MPGYACFHSESQGLSCYWFQIYYMVWTVCNACLPAYPHVCCLPLPPYVRLPTAKFTVEFGAEPAGFAAALFGAAAWFAT